MVEGKWLRPGEELTPVLAIRQTVLHRGQDALDAQSWQVLVIKDGQNVGTGRIWYQEGDFMLGDLCVLPEARHLRMGDLLVRLLLFKALSHAARQIAVVCPAPYVPFFEKYGFTPDSTLENGVTRLSILGENVQLDTCSRHCKACPQGCGGDSCPG